MNRTNIAVVALAALLSSAGVQSKSAIAAPPCATAPTPPQPPAAARPAAKPTDNVDTPLLDARAKAKQGAADARAALENAALREIFQQAPGRQAGPAVARVRGVMNGNSPEGMGMATFGGTIARLHFFPDAGSIVKSAVKKAREQGWALPQGNSPADLVVARSKGPAAGAPTPLRIEFLVPSSKQEDFKKFTSELETKTKIAALGEAWKVGYQAVGKLTGAKPPAVSITMDISGDFTKQLAEQKQDAMEMIAASAYTAGLQKETRRGTRERWAIGQRIATQKVTDGLYQSYSQPNNAKVQQVANVAGATVLAEVASQDELGAAVEQLGKAGPGSELGLIFDPATSAAQRAQFQATGAGAIGVRMRLPNGDVATFQGATSDQLAQVLAFATVHPEATAAQLSAKFGEVRKK